MQIEEKKTTQIQKQSNSTISIIKHQLDYFSNMVALPWKFKQQKKALERLTQTR